MYRGIKLTMSCSGLIHGEATPKFMTKKSSIRLISRFNMVKTSFHLPKLSHIDTTTGAETSRYKVDRKSHDLFFLLGLKHGRKLHFEYVNVFVVLLFENNKRKNKSERDFLHFYILFQ